MGDTTISWTDKTWNPIRGCRRVSAGCANCYAERQAARFAGPGGAYEGLIKLTANGPRWSGETRFVADHLADPLRWRKPVRVFVDSMSDLFYEGFTNEQIAAVFGVMAAAPQHTFQVLTKRARRMREWFEWVAHYGSTCSPRAIVWTDAQNALHDVNLRTAFGRRFDVAQALKPSLRDVSTWPLPNVWLGVSVENQEAADERIPDLLATPAAIRFLSCEPLLGPVDLAAASPNARSLVEDLDWIIAGCESGSGARECKVEWLRSLRDQCAHARVPFFLKQAVSGGGSFAEFITGARRMTGIWLGPGSREKGRGFGGRTVIEPPYLDGVQHAAFPEVRR